MVFSSGQRRREGPGFAPCYSTVNPDWLNWLCSQMPLSISQFTTESGDSGLCHTVCTPPILRLAGGRFNPWCNSEQPQGCSGLCCFLTVSLGLPYLGMHLTCHVTGEAGGKGDRNHCIELPTDMHTVKSSWKLFHFRHLLENTSKDNREKSAMEKAPIWLVPYWGFFCLFFLK